MANDLFANIAASGIGGRLDLLNEPQPIKYEKAIIKLKEAINEPVQICKKIDTKEGLERELFKMREKYKSFLENYAPEIKKHNQRIDLTTFLLDGKEITIPHYGGPLGFAEQIYTTDFKIDEIIEHKAIFICFKGADYKATVYINDICVGQHEGFFSPFEFEITRYAKLGNNTLKVQLENDYIYMGNAFATQEKIEGDKLYAATGLGYDDPEKGWHHCPPGMGIYNDVFVEFRNKVHITDVFVRPLNDMAEIWVEVNNTEYYSKNIEFYISIFGQNFKATALENYKYIPTTQKTVGMGDSLTEAKVKADGELGIGIAMPLKKGLNTYKIPIKIENPKIWRLEEPYLYQAQVSVSYNNEITDSFVRQFGMREFKQDLYSTPKGMFYLNGEKIRLRGANTMGFEQQDVLKKDFNQLIDDILLAKICNMNFLRLTQRPVQDEVYEYCDKLGLMTQTDLPLFGCMRKTKFAEGIRQSEEMEKLIRSHPCNVIISYINEPFPNANNEPHRHLEREELQEFFKCCDSIVKLNNPDRVIKHIDGDYDPPCDSMPDNHCYPMWYNGHGIDIGKLNKGYWLNVKPDWYYGCGEYGAEGLDFAEIMKLYYPEEWLKEPFNPNNIIGAQTGNFHYFFYDTQDNIEKWVEESHAHQAYATKIMTEAFRRDERMITNAIHLFIDAFPSGWMKTIMDFKRNPKPAYFEYRNALEPIMVSLRTDRFTYYEDETISIESYICNDTNDEKQVTVLFELYQDNSLIMSNERNLLMNPCGVTFVGNVEFLAPKVNDREKIKIKAIIIKEDTPITYNELEIEIFKDVEILQNKDVVLIEKLPVGEHCIAGEKVVVKPCGMLPLHFVSRNTGHSAVEEFMPKDFSHWYNKSEDMITPILETTFEASGFNPILTSGNMDDTHNWNKALAVAEKEFDGKIYVICQVDLRIENPIAKRFLKEIMLQL